MQKIQLSIPEPCHENWQNMSPTDQGRFCNACAKTVVDFSRMTDIEVLNYFSSLKNEKVCGRLLPVQLEGPISRPKEPKKRLFWYWNYITLFFLFFSRSTVKAQTTKGKVVAVPIVKQPCTPMMGMVASGFHLNTGSVISGKITDENGNGIPSAMIRVKGEEAYTTTNAYGVYSLKIEGSKNIIEISAAGYRTIDFSFKEIKAYNFMLVKNVLQEKLMAIAGGISFTNLDNNKCTVKNSATLEVKDKETGQPIEKAVCIVKQFGVNKTDTFFTNKSGSYRVNKISQELSYSVKISANGYEALELTISRDDFKSNNIIKEIFLSKIKKPVERMMGEVVLANDNNIKSDKRLIIRCSRSIFNNGQALWIVDDIQHPIGYMSSLNPNDIASINVLKGASAIALYGEDASNGVIIITTKTKKDTDQVKIAKDSLAKTVINKVADTINTMFNPNSIWIYPNPIQKGNAFFISSKLKQSGNVNIQISDLAGRVLLKKQSVKTEKEFLEKIETDSRWGSGVYFISVFDSNNKLINKSSFIVQ